MIRLDLLKFGRVRAMGQQRPFTALKDEKRSLVGETKGAKLAFENET